MRSGKSLLVERVRLANDMLRGLFQGGEVVYSEWIQTLDDKFRAEITKAVMDFDAHLPGSQNDPDGVHCFGSILVRDFWIIWKITTYHLDGTPAPDLADPHYSHKVLTIKTAYE